MFEWNLYKQEETPIAQQILKAYTEHGKEVYTDAGQLMPFHMNL